MTSSYTSLVLPIVLVACLYLAPTTTGTATSGSNVKLRSERSSAHRTSRQMALASLLRRRRSDKENWMADFIDSPPFNPYGTKEKAVPAKREEEKWIWMPAYGYVPMPTDDGTDNQQDRDRIGNLLRYGK